MDPTLEEVSLLLKAKEEEVNKGNDTVSEQEPIADKVKAKSAKLRKHKSGIIKLKNKLNRSGRMPRMGSLKPNTFSGRKIVSRFETADYEDEEFESKTASSKSGRLAKSQSMKKTLRSRKHAQTVDRSEKFKNSIKSAGDTTPKSMSMKQKATAQKRRHLPFTGVWESTEVEEDAFMQEMSISATFKKLAMSFAGDVKQELIIRQGRDISKDATTEEFLITEKNDRREIKYCLILGEEFTLFNEKDEELLCKGRWGETKGGTRKTTELIVEQKNVVTGKITTIKRKVNSLAGTLLETRQLGSDPEVCRTYMLKGLPLSSKTQGKRSRGAVETDSDSECDI